MTIFLLFLAILPTIVLGYFIYSNDKIEKEPTPLLVKLGIAGIGSVFLTLAITYVLYLLFPFFAIADVTTLNVISLALYVFIGIALIEEFSKWILTYSIAWRNKAFNHVYDAIVYSVFVSLGFATIENILYVFGGNGIEEAISIALNRMVFSVPGHTFFGVMMGYYLGLAKLTHVHGLKEKSKKYLFYSLAIPTICHFIFDYILMSELPILIFFGFVGVLFGIGISKVKRLSNIPTNIFNDPNNLNYVYNAFGNYSNQNQTNSNIIQNNNIQNISNNSCKYCKNCGTELKGPFCGYCGTKNY